MFVSIIFVKLHWRLRGICHPVYLQCKSVIYIYFKNLIDMATSMNYSVVARKNPSKKSEPAKYYALAQASGELDFDEMCEAITGRTTCTETDVPHWRASFMRRSVP